MLAEIRFGNL